MHVRLTCNCTGHTETAQKMKMSKCMVDLYICSLFNTHALYPKKLLEDVYMCLLAINNHNYLSCSATNHLLKVQALLKILRINSVATYLYKSNIALSPHLKYCHERHRGNLHQKLPSLCSKDVSRILVCPTGNI